MSREYYVGNILTYGELLPIIVFHNDFKKENKHPDLFIKRLKPKYKEN